MVCNMLKKMLILVLIPAIIFGTTPMTFAEDADTSAEITIGYDIVLGSEGLLSGYDLLDEESYMIGNQPVKRTYLLSLRYETFSITNNSGSVISKTGLVLINGSNPVTGSFTRGGSRNADYLDNSMKARLTDKGLLADAGYISLDEDATAYYYLYFSAVDYAVLIQITPNGATNPVEDARRELGEQIGLVTGDSADDYYQTDDRYNGSITSENGFWTDLQNTLTEVRKIYDNSKSAAELNRAKETLTEYINRLIPVNYINATELYEAIGYYQSLLWNGTKAAPGIKKEGENTMAVEESNTSSRSWAAYQSALTNAENLLRRLYDGSGNPTFYNNSSDKSLQDDMTAAIADLTDAVALLEPRAEATEVTSAEIAVSGINLYAATLYGPDIVSADAYTADSYQAYVSTREDALTLVKEAEVCNGMSSTLSKKCVNAYAALRKACFALKEKDKTSISVRFSAVDTYAMSREAEPMEVNTTSLTLPAGATVDDALKEADVSLVARGKLNERNGVFLNGMFLTQGGNFAVAPPQIYEAYYSDYQLKDGDELTVIRFLPPWYTNVYYGTEWLYSIADKPEAIQYARISTSEEKKTAGNLFSVSVSYDGALPTTYTGIQTPLKGAKIYVSSVCASEAEARRAALSTDTESVTDESGNTSLILYEGGWYAMNILAEGNGNCLGCQTVILHVDDAEDVNEIKDDLLDKLTACVGKYQEGFFHADDWKAVSDSYTEAASVIEAAQESGSAWQAEQTALKTIRSFQEKAEKYNTKNLKNFRTNLDLLPDDISRLDQSADTIIKNLQSCYEKMTVYQSEQLRQLEQTKYEAIVAAYAAGLPEPKAYELSFEVKMKGGSDEDLAALNEMLAWINDNNGVDDSVTEITGGTSLPNVNTFGYGKTSWDFYDTVETCTATKSLLACVSPDNAIYLRVRDAGGRIEGDGWSIDDKNIIVAADDLLYGRLCKNMVYTINGTNYAIDSVIVDGLDADEYSYTDMSFFDTSTYKGKDENCINLYFKDAILAFNMPFNDVKVTVTWKPVLTDRADLSDKKESAKEEIKSLFDTYEEESYESDTWESIVAAKDDGLLAVEHAATDKAINDAKLDAVNEMLMGGACENMIGMEGVEIPDFGDIVGRVYVSVDNSTWKDAPGVFRGTFVSGWYDLCEKDTMMTSILKALSMEDAEISWLGTGGDAYGITYLSTLYIDENENGRYDKGQEPGIAEFDNGNLSGWMGTLNDWFTNFGFQEFSYENGGLKSGDVINIGYTSDGAGADLGGSWRDSDTRLSSLSVSGGTLAPSFDSDITDYIFTIAEEKAKVNIETVANNKNYQVRTYLNYYDNDDAQYRATQSLVVKSGDVIYVGCGEYHWPSMNNQGTESRDYSGTRYTIKVVKSGSVEQATEAISNIEKIKYSSYQSVKNTVNNARAAYDALNQKDKDAFDTGLYKKLISAEQMIADYSELDEFKARLAEVDTKTVTDSVAKQLVITYENMTESQTGNLTLAEKNKAEALRYGISYEWAEDYSRCTACIRNRFDENDTYTETVDSVKTVIREASETASGKAIYKAVFTDERLKEQTVTVITSKKETESGDNQAESDKEQAYANRPVNKITASSLVKEYSTYKKTYSINARVLGSAKLSYSSSSGKVKVSSKGVITVPAKYVGKVTITIKAADTDQYKAVSKKITITVNPKTTSIVSVKNTAAGKMTVKWKRNSAVTGYQLQYSTSSSFKSGNKSLSVISNKTLYKTVKSLKKKKTYYVRIRTYKKMGTTKYYSKWSTKKSVKISR